jgi:hypothetical protein
LIESDDTDRDGPQKTFRITPAGADELAEWLRTPPDLASPPRDELVIKVLVALRLPGVDMSALLQAHRRQVVELMQRYTNIKAEATPDDVSLPLIADAELFRLESVVRWIDAAEARLSQQPAAGVTERSAEAQPARTRWEVRT